jgi:dipeptidyl aminopeptidase/acylaminoacyl peptidase
MDGSVMAFTTYRRADAVPDLWLLPAGEGAEPRPFIESASAETSPAISPDGKWIAFVSNESGALEVYVAPLAAKDPARAKLRISDRGGSDPVWSRDGSELFFEDPAERLMAAAVQTDGGAEAFGVPEVVLDLKALGLTTNADGSYDVSPDGSRFVFGRTQGGVAGGSEIFVVLDWFAELE